MKSPKIIHETHDSIKEMIKDSGLEVIKEWTSGSVWRLQIKHGEKIIFLVHPEKMRWVKVIFAMDLDDAEVLRKINDLFNHPKTGPQAIYLMRSTINNPHSGFEIIMKDDQFSGFHISMNIFPFERDFSIRDLDQAIQTIVAVGIAGIDYLRMLMGNIVLQQKAIDEFPKTDPGQMYG